MSLDEACQETRKKSCSQFKGRDGNTWLKVPSLVRGKRIAIPTNSKVVLKGMLRLILRDQKVYVHYLANGKKSRPCGDRIVGVDKGYTEVFADSEGDVHGEHFHKVLTQASESRMKKNKVRNKLYQIAKKSDAKKKCSNL